MITNNLSIAIVEEHHLEKWLHARILTVKGSGFIFRVSRRRIFRRSGTVWIAKNRGIRPGTQFLEVISLIRKMLMLDMHSNIMRNSASSIVCHQFMLYQDLKGSIFFIVFAQLLMIMIPNEF